MSFLNNPQPNKNRSHIVLLICLTLTLTSCGSGDTTDSSTSTSPSSTPAAVGTTVEVSVEATDDPGDILHYRWAATEGTIKDVDAPKTTWVVPPGSGLHFAYVVVSDDKGGYVEQRAAALSYGEPVVTSTATITPDPLPCKPNCRRGFVWGSVYTNSYGRRVYLPGVKIQLYDGATAVGSPATTDMKGQFVISNLADKTYTVKYTIPGRAEVPFSTSTTVAANTNLPTSPSDSGFFEGEIDLSTALQIAGSVRLSDKSYCGIRNEFFTRSNTDPMATTNDARMFTHPISATAQLLDDKNNPLSASFPVNHYGDFLIVRNAAVPSGITPKVRITCEGAPAVDVAPPPLPNSGAIKLSTTVTIPNKRPTINSMTVFLNGQDISRPDLPKPRTMFGSKKFSTSPYFGSNPDLIAELIDVPGDDTFFTYKGIDSRITACRYYQAIGAVEKCDANGFAGGNQLTLNQWKSTFHLSPFSPSDPSVFAADGQEVRVQYINRSDLNLTRDMQAVKLANGDLAYNVCNYPGPQDVTDPLGAPAEIGAQTADPVNDPSSDPSSVQSNIDLAIDNARRNIGMIACVAMDYQVKDGITRFYTFGPSGKLLLSLSLDGRREKFMPGTCTTCHGGDAYGGHYSPDGSIGPDLKSRWQPFDMANLKVSFASSADLAAINEVVKELNERMIRTDLDPKVSSITTSRTRQLIERWYKNGPVQDPTVIPDASPSKDPFIYRNIIQPGCQTCHAAQKKNEFFDTTKVCGGSPVLEQNHVMTNSLVPFERFWLDSTLPPKLGCGTIPTKHKDL